MATQTSTLALDDDRRSGDRRARHEAVNLRRLGLRGRRTGARRSEDNTYRYVDYYEPRLLYASLLVVICCCLDAFFTLQLLNRGAVEINAFMAALIETDIQTFVNLKISLTCLCLVFLVIHADFRLFHPRIRVEHLLMSVLAAYLTLIGYEIYLLLLPPLPV